MPDHNIPLPLYYKVVQEMINRIKAGVYKEGTKIPSLKVLAQEFHVSDVTVRRAIRELEEAGYLITRQGRNAVVKNHREMQKISCFKGWYDTLSENGPAPKTSECIMKTVNANPTIAQQLEIEAGEPVIEIYRLRCANDQPYCVMYNYFKTGYLPDVGIEKIKEESLYHFLKEDLKKDLSVCKDVFEAIRADRFCADKLNIIENDPVLKVLRTEFDSNRSPVGVSIVISRTDTYTYYVISD